ncbi:MAG: hypothetical protein EOP45_03375 [Sphingobacteriaceae bacterium]|nr:MAG: hypothetical protein EOP45_03375 [Sphingobacteriaceae bacterium]
MEIDISEIKIVGNWSFDGSKIIADEQSLRIERLIANYLTKIKTDYSGWDTLYRDPDDGRYWELIYPKSEMQGGGPPSLILLSDDQASNKYTL